MSQKFVTTMTKLQVSRRRINGRKTYQGSFRWIPLNDLHMGVEALSPSAKGI